MVYVFYWCDIRYSRGSLFELFEFVYISFNERRFDEEEENWKKHKSIIFTSNSCCLYCYCSLNKKAKHGLHSFLVFLEILDHHSNIRIHTYMYILYPFIFLKAKSVNNFLTKYHVNYILKMGKTLTWVFLRRATGRIWYSMKIHSYKKILIFLMKE